MSKSRRKVTVDTAKSVSDDSEKRKPSVFERLGPGGGQRKYDYEAEVNMAPYLYHSLPLFLLLNSLTPPPLTHTHDIDMIVLTSVVSVIFTFTIIPVCFHCELGIVSCCPNS